MNEKQIMQFDHRPQQILCGGDSLQSSYLPNSKLSISLLNRQSRFQADSDDDKKPAGRWAKVDGKWTFVKESSADETVKPKECSALNKQSVSSPTTKSSTLPVPSPTKSSALPVPSAATTTTPTPTQSSHSRISPEVIRNAGAKQIQRIVRGYRQRILFRVLKLQHILDTADQRTAESIAEIRREVAARKEKYYNKMRLQARKELAAIDEEKALVFDAKQNINRLREENKKLRKEGKKLREEIAELKASNENLEKVNDVVADTFAQLQEEVANIQKAHDALQAAIPEYRETVEKLSEESELRHQYIMAEQGVKLRYMKVIGQIVENVQDECNDAKLVDEVVGYVLAVDANNTSESKP